MQNEGVVSHQESGDQIEDIAPMMTDMIEEEEKGKAPEVILNVEEQDQRDIMMIDEGVVGIKGEVIPLVKEIEVIGIAVMMLILQMVAGGGIGVKDIEVTIQNITERIKQLIMD